MEDTLSHGTDHSHTDKGTFTCQTCSIAFYTPDLQRTHYRSDWHRYNLKRRVANLTSVSATTFAEKVLAQKSLAATSAERANFAERCEPCGKVYYSENAYNNHIGSKKHRDTVKAALTRAEATADAESNDGSTHDSTFSLEDSVEPSQASIYESSTASPAPEREIPGPAAIDTDTPSEEDQIRAKLEKAVKLPLGECLFCRTVQTGEDDVQVLSENVNHMIKAHSLFLPEQEYLVDMRGLIEYLQTKVSVGNFCLACNKGFRNIEACRAHMASTSHRRIAYSSEDEQMEISDFYDFSATWDGIDGDGDWEDTSDAEADDDDDDDDDGISTIDSAANDVVADDFELRLPSGAVAGHRSLARYYRQNLRGRDPHAEHGGSAVHRAIMDRTQAARQALVANSLAGVDPGRKKWSNRHVETFVDVRRREDFKTRVGYRGNNKKHYTPQLLQ
ncbi:Ribosome biogenesis protein [Taphrina deformans PYCC 5710]|uniref:Ribosome biogenesis protein n=1 Tax=Taphrina deformans (strain PYCC 5710 / ATCC 11124 / CBS 356.35 / IMI 108563 / JCM 9778 / NBRC 8474) TaxID=1097556 RepID=R4XB72_TAPDE|nr:Ribosome biogenesis protein [Taphrina deformans PYCC 5710]|eukprot:CCG83073.1 Ribosome biogenesis protein [Taphrina deformans PYCC 5710]